MASSRRESTARMRRSKSDKVRSADTLGELVVIILGGRRPAMIHARALLHSLVDRVHEVSDVDEAVLRLFAEVADLLVVDSANASQYRDDLVNRAVPALLADQIPLIWIGGGTDVIDSLDRQLTEVVLDTPFSVRDVTDALSVALWAGNASKSEVEMTQRPTLPIGKPAGSSVGPAASREARASRRETIPYDGVHLPLNGRPRRGPRATTDEVRALRQLQELSELEGGGTPPVPQSMVTNNVGRVPRRPLRPYDSPSSNQGMPPLGTVIANRYTVLGLLGRGGSAWVLKVRDRELNETVALKLMRTDVEDEMLRRRFRREMRVCRKLVHPNIVRAFEFGFWNTRMYYTMELLEGADFAHLMLHKHPARLTVADALRLLAQACEALQAAHQFGIVHRDIKPQNLFVLSNQHELKVTDFGVAKGTGDVGLTITHGNLVVGTPAYLAPERLEDTCELSDRTDIYSLGATMYHVFTGRLPFPAPDLATLLTAIVTRTPEHPRSINPMLPVQLDATIRRAMHRDPQMRQGSCLQLRDELLTIERDLESNNRNG